MAKTWYPVVDYLNCEECGTCVNMCPHGVYDTAKSPSPVVMNPLECVDHCHGCGNRCPAGAITYVGDNTGWTPPNGTQQITGSLLFRRLQRACREKSTCGILISRFKGLRPLHRYGQRTRRSDGCPFAGAGACGLRGYVQQN